MDDRGRIAARATVRDIPDHPRSRFTYLAVDYCDNLYVTDPVSHAVHKFDRNLTYLTTFGGPGTGDAQFLSPRGIAIYRRFGQTFIVEKDGAQYYWVGADLRSFSGLFRRGRQAGLRLSIHAGEIGDARNVRTAILKWGADRIGHGVRAHRDRSVLRLALRRRVPFEMCLTSNRDTGAWRRPETHPIARLVREGLRVTLNTDDPAASAIDLTHECRLAVTALGLGPREILRLQANAAESAFLEESDRRRLLSRIDPLLFGFPTL